MNLIALIHRYLSTQILKWFAITLGVLLCIISFFDAIELIRRLSSTGYVPAGQVLEMLILKWPSHINSLLPFITFLGIIFGFMKLNQHNEVTALRAMGVSIWQLAMISSAAVLAVGLVNLVVVGPMGAAMSKRLSHIEEKVFKNRSAQKLFISNSGLWFRDVRPDGTSSVMHATNINLNLNKLGGITFYVFDSQHVFTRRIDAVYGELKPGHWQLHGCETYVSGQKSIKEETIELSTDLSLAKFMHSQLEPASLSFWELAGFINVLKKSGLSTRAYDMHWHKQMADIGFMVALTLLALNFCLRPQRYHNVFVSLFYGVLISFVCYFVDDIIYALGLSGRLPLFLAAWMMPLVIAMLSIYALIHTEDHI